MQDSCLAVALNIRAPVYFSKNAMVITGPETLSMEKVTEIRFEVDGEIPVTSVTDFQQDTISTDCVWALLQSLVQQFKEMIYHEDNWRLV